MHKILESAAQLDNKQDKNRGGKKLHTCSKIKQHFKIEQYLTLIHNTAHRRALTQLRLRSHQLHIETLRGTVREPRDRLCTKCSLSKTEDEIHFITECPHYIDHRQSCHSTIIAYHSTITLFLSNAHSMSAGTLLALMVGLSCVRVLSLALCSLLDAAVTKCLSSLRLIVVSSADSFLSFL